MLLLVKKRISRQSVVYILSRKFIFRLCFSAVQRRLDIQNVGGTGETERFDLTIPEKNISGPLFFPQLEKKNREALITLSIH